MKLDITITHRHESPDLCPPHDFQIAWATPGEQTNGVALCAACGEVQSLDAPSVGAPVEESRRG